MTVPAATDQRVLASMLATLSAPELAALLTARGISPTVGWRDFFDAADGMLEPTAVSRALESLPATPARALSAAVLTGSALTDAAAADLAGRAFAGTDGQIFDAVADAVRQVGALAPPTAPAASTNNASDDATAAERAFTSAASLADILLLCLETPLGRIGSGSLGAVDRRRLLEAGAIPAVEDADLLVEIAETGGLLTGRERTFLVSPVGREWLRTTTAARWESIALALRDALPAGLREPTGGWIPAPEWPDAYPFDRSWPAVATEWRRRLTAWGLLTDEGTEPTWAAPLARGAHADTASWERMLPPEVDRVYLQNDLTAIAPGPLAPELDVRLRTMARRESRAQASTYRFTADTVAAAITGGETAESLRDFLQKLSLTGLPQPLAYVIDSTAARHGRVRVHRDADTGLTRVTSADPALLATIAVDQALRPLGLVDDGDELVSRAAHDTVFWALADAKYPVIAVDAQGAPRTLDRARLAGDSPLDAPVQRYAALLERLHASASDGDEAWLERELDHAVRARAIVDVDVALPDGTTRTFRLEATGLGGGRLRGRDRGADVERTLPLTSIVSVRPAG
ncbi:helicase-associated domain-containing protein [Microbacterium sp. P05]|uniref:helicase-associated domain-containing protein n=1 Tax=Microbacterium sp. P05 TaxID=3366948 RepID=UPI003745A124